MDGIIAYALAKKYVEESLIGVGAIKGAPCTIKEITPTSDGNKITFEWTDTLGAKHTSSLEVENGKSEVYTGTEEPTDPYKTVWINPEGITDDVLRADNVKTINGQSIVGTGDIEIKGGESTGFEKYILNDVPAIHELYPVGDTLSVTARYTTEASSIVDAIEVPMVVDGILNPKIQHVLGNNSGRIIHADEDGAYYLYPDNNKNCDVGSFRIMFSFDGDKLELILRGYSHLRLFVDEGNGFERRYSGIAMKKYERKDKVCAMFNFGSAKQRNIIAEFELRCPFGGFVYEKKYSIYPCAIKMPLAQFIGSSLTAGGMQQYDSWNYIVAQRLGLDWINNGEGGTGFASTASGLEGKTSVKNRISTDVFPKKPWLLTLEGSYNDMGGDLTVENYINNVLKPLFADVVENLPNCLSIVIGTFATCRDRKWQGVIDWDDKNNALRQTALEYHFPFIDTLNGKVYDSLGNLIVNEEPWFTGTGYAGNPMGDGNSDIYVKDDKTHFNTDGDKYVANKMLESIMAIIFAEKTLNRTPANIPVFNLKKSELVLTVGDTETVGVYPYDASATLTSSNSSIVSVSGNNITAVASGVALLTATYNGVTDTCLINVMDQEEPKMLSSISATKTKTTYEVGETVGTSDVTVTASYTDSTSKVVSTWTSNASSIDTSTEGTKTLTITYTENSITKTADIQLIVSATPTPVGGDAEVVTNCSISSTFKVSYEYSDTKRCLFFPVISGKTYDVTVSDIYTAIGIRTGYSDEELTPEQSMSSYQLTDGVIKWGKTFSVTAPKNGYFYMFTDKPDYTATYTVS